MEYCDSTPLLQCWNGWEGSTTFVNEEKINAIGSIQNARVIDFIGAMKKRKLNPLRVISVKELSSYMMVGGSLDLNTRPILHI